MARDIRPIKLVLHTGSVYTLWAPRWRDGADEWQAFLGVADELYGFDTIAELVAFVRSGDDHDLREHPSWRYIEALSADEFTPEAEDRYDLTRVPRTAASEPTFASTRFLDDCITLVFALGDVCDAESITDFFEEHGELDLLGSGAAPFQGRSGARRWARIGSLLAGEWDGLLARIDDLITSPDLDPAAVELAESELVAADETDVENDDELDTDDDLDLLDSEYAEDPGQGGDTMDFEDRYAFWEDVGIDPIQIIVLGGSFFTLRCYLRDEPVFLGREGRIRVFPTPWSLNQHLADNNDHDLARLPTYGPVAEAATGGELDVVVTDDNVYMLTGLIEDLGDGPEAVDLDQLDMAVELLEDAADYSDDDSVERALASQTALGSLVAFIQDPHRRRRPDRRTLDAAAGQWETLQNDFEDRLVHPGG